jgi:cell shape-determining protein MreC
MYWQTQMEIMKSQNESLKAENERKRELLQFVKRQVGILSG